MPIISDIAIKIRAITAPFTNGLEQAARKSKKFSASIEGAFRGITNITQKAALAIAGITAIFAAIAAKGIQAASSLESLNSQFSVLLRSQEKANARMAELVKFSSETPFQINQIAKANKVLESLTKGALSTAEGMRLVGDAAAFAARPMDEIAVQIGRLFSGIQSGTAVGEPIARLRELGIISGETGQKIADMIKAGAKGNAVWAIAAKDLKRVEGTMKAMSQTTEGLASTLKDNVNLAFAELGKVLLPSVKQFLKDMIPLAQKLTKGISNFAAGLQKSAKVGIAFGKLFETIFNAISKAFSVSGPNAVKDFENSLLRAIGTAAFFFDKIGKVAKGSMTQDFKDIGSIITLAFKSIWDGLGNIGVQMLDNFTRRIMLFTNILTDVKDLVDNVLSDNKKGVDNASDRIAGSLSGLTKSFSGDLDKSLDVMDNFRKAFEKNLEEFAKKSKDKKGGGIAAVMDALLTTNKNELNQFLDKFIKDVDKRNAELMNINTDFNVNLGDPDKLEDALEKVKLEPKLALRGSQEATRLSANSQSNQQKIESHTKATAKATEMMAKMMTALVNTSGFNAAGSPTAVNVFDPAQVGGAVGLMGGVQ